MARRNPKVSVIMPVYNVDRYVGRAIESLQNQTMRDFELLIVDDGSTDRSGDIADRFAERDIRIDVFHTPNSGAPAARNYALDRAQGTYVQFFDADDWAEPTMLADLVAIAERDNAELVISGFYIDTVTTAMMVAIYLRRSTSRQKRMIRKRIFVAVLGNCSTRTCCTPPGISSFCAVV